MKSHPKICVLGGCGTMGRVIVTCLLRHSRNIQVTVADRRPPSISFPSRVHFSKIDLFDHSRLVHLLRSHAVVINSTSHHFNLPVMQAALDAGVHYLDLGGLFHFTRRQLKLDAAFRKKHLIAILGMGCAPGVANLMAQWAAEGMDRVDEIHIKIGGRSWGSSAHAIPYAIGTIREELTLKPALYHNHQWCFKKPLSGMEWFQFPKPVGRQKVFNTIHSEVATLPLSFPGLKECSFKIGFSNEMIKMVLGKNVPQSRKLSELCPRDCEFTVALVRGRTNKKSMTRIACYKSFSSEGHSAGDWNTAWPPAITALMIASGKIKGEGVFAPEAMVPLYPLMEELKKVGFRFSRYQLKFRS